MPTKNLIARYTARLLTDRQWNRALKALAPQDRQDLRAWRRQTLANYQWHSLWRCLVTDPQNPQRWNVAPNEVAWVTSHLTPHERRRLRHLANTIPTYRFTKQEQDTALRHLKKHSTFLAHKKLRFIVTYDTGQGHDDMVAHLLEKGLRTLYRYEAEGNLLKAINYAKMAVRNEVVNLCVSNKRAKRARLIERSCQDRVWQSSSVSLDAVTLPDGVSRTLEIITERHGPELEHFARCILGSFPAFDAWLAVNGHNVSKLKPRDVARLASAFVGVKLSDAQRLLGPLLTE